MQQAACQRRATSGTFFNCIVLGVLREDRGNLDKPQFAGLRWPGSTRVVVLGQGVGDHVLAIRSCVRISLSSSVLHAAAYLVLNDPSHLLHKCVQFLRIGLNEETRSQFAHRLRLLLCSRIWPHGHSLLAVSTLSISRNARPYPGSLNPLKGLG